MTQLAENPYKGTAERPCGNPRPRKNPPVEVQPRRASPVQFIALAFARVSDWTAKDLSAMFITKHPTPDYGRRAEPSIHFVRGRI